MSTGAGHQEIEIKLSLKSAQQGRRLLSLAGFRVRRRRAHEQNWVLDTPDFRLRSMGQMLRVRQSGGQAMLTVKGRSIPGKHKSRPEVETAIQDATSVMQVLRALGYAIVFRYEKYRTEYANEAFGGVVCLDETPIGVFLEIEGPADWIDATAASLGFDESAYITMSYADLSMRVQRRKTGRSTDMLFRPDAPWKT